MEESSHIEQENRGEQDGQQADIGTTAPPKFSWKGFLSGSFVNDRFVKLHWRFMLFLFILSVIYISNRHVFSRTVRENRVLRKEVAKSKAKFITKSADLARMKKRSQVLKEIEERKINLEESKEPPKRVEK